MIQASGPYFILCPSDCYFGTNNWVLSLAIDILALITSFITSDWYSWHKWLLAAKSGPLDFMSEKSFLLSFAHEKGLGHMF